MALRQKVRLTLDDGSDVEVVYDGRDLRAWESDTGRSAFTEPMSLTMLTWLAWHAAKRQNLLNGSGDTFAAFDANCADVATVREAPPDPTQPATTSTPTTG